MFWVQLLRFLLTAAVMGLLAHIIGEALPRRWFRAEAFPIPRVCMGAKRQILSKARYPRLEGPPAGQKQACAQRLPQKRGSTP